LQEGWLLHISILQGVGYSLPFFMKKIGLVTLLGAFFFGSSAQTMKKSHPRKRRPEMYFLCQGDPTQLSRYPAATFDKNPC
jgi:hypothetical protein